MRKLKAIKGHTYDRVFQKVGSIYSAKDRDAKVLIAVRRSVEYVEPKPEPKPKRTYTRRTVKPEESKRTYTRKDMQAE